MFSKNTSFITVQNSGVEKKYNNISNTEVVTSVTLGTHFGSLCKMIHVIFF